MSIQTEQEINNIKIDVFKMAGLVQRNLENAISAVAHDDRKLARKIIGDDQIINNWLKTIEKKIIHFQALHQPAAKDLLYSSTYFHIAIILEHIGEQTLAISKKVLSKPGMKEDMPSSTLLNELCALTCGMYEETIALFQDQSSRSFEYFSDANTQALELTMKILRFYVEFMTNEDAAIERTNNIVFITRGLKFICDYLMNIVNNIMFVMWGGSVGYVPSVATRQ
jgi:phosphate transport system protein